MCLLDDFKINHFVEAACAKLEKLSLTEWLYDKSKAQNEAFLMNYVTLTVRGLGNRKVANDDMFQNDNGTIN